MELDYYFVAYKLKIDIDEIRSWPYVKVYKWLIALRKITERMNEESEKLMNEAEMKASIDAGEDVIIRNASYKP